MSQSFFKIRCPHCSNQTQGSAGGWGVFGNEVTRCSNKKCTKLFETLPNSFNWVNADSDDTSPKEAGPKKPKKSVQRELRLAFLKFEKASKIHEAAQAQATPNEQLFIKRGRRYIPVSREGLE